MKNNTWMTGVLCLMLGGALLTGLPGCSVRKKGGSELQEKKKSVRLETDSLLIGRRRQAGEHSVRYFQQIRLSAPDSTGRQYIRTITQATSAAGRTETAHDSLSLQSAASTALYAESRQKEFTGTDRTVFGWKWVIAGILVAGTACFLWWGKRRE